MNAIINYGSSATLVQSNNGPIGADGFDKAPLMKGMKEQEELLQLARKQDECLGEHLEQ